MCIVVSHTETHQSGRALAFCPFHQPPKFVPISRVRARVTQTSRGIYPLPNAGLTGDWVFVFIDIHVCQMWAFIGIHG